MLEKIKSTPPSVWDIFFSVPLAIMFTVSPSYIASGNFVFTGSAFLRVLLYFIVFFAVASTIRIGLLKLDFNIGFFQKLLNHKHALLILSLIMLLLWLPILIILYPGTVINDTWGQLSQFVYTFYSDSTIHFEYL